MTSLTKEEYLKLIEDAREEQEEENYDTIPPGWLDDSAWIPAESSAKEQMNRARASNAHGVIDAFKYRKEQIRDALYKCMNLKIGAFIIHVEEYHGRPTIKKMPPSAQLTMDITVYQEKYQTPSGAPCKMSYKMDFSKDSRFANRPWLSYFNAQGAAHNIPVETVVEVVRWMQNIKKLSAFL